jgi:hypothetical protein
MAVGLRADRDSLLSQRAPANDAIHPCSRQCHTHGSANHLCRRGAQNLVVRESLATEATADVGRDHTHLLRLEAKNPGNRRRLGSDHLRRVMNGQLVHLPQDSRGMWLDRVVIVPRCAIHMVDLVGRRCEHRLGVADLVQQGLAHEYRRLRPRHLCGGERSRGWLGHIGRDDQ